MPTFVSPSELDFLRSEYQSPEEEPASIQDSPFIYILYSTNQKELAPFFHERSCRPGEIIVLENEPGDNMFLILSGAVAIVKGDFAVPSMLWFRAVGSIIGEMALIENRPRYASVVAVEDTCLLSMDREKFFQFLGQYPAVNQSIMNMLSTRLRGADDMISSQTLNERRLLKRVQELADEKQRLEERQALYDKAHEIIAALRDQAIRDPLTDLFNRRYMEETLAREISRARREKIPVSVIMIDIDHFKQVNDLYGHQAGDLVLQSLGRMLKNSVRVEDITCRYGGEEFCVVMPGATLEIAQRRAEMIRHTFEQMRVQVDGRTISTTLSLGAASCPYDGASGEDLLLRADQALYQAKHSGRNRVMINN